MTLPIMPFRFMSLARGGKEMVPNGGMEGVYTDESGGGGGTINVAPDWDELNCELAGTDTLDASATAHSGSKSQSINVDATDEGIQNHGVVFGADTKWYLVTVWLYGVAGNVKVQDAAAEILSETVTPAVGSWTEYSWVAQSAGTSRALYITSTGGAANFLVDDVSVIQFN